MTDQDLIDRSRWQREMFATVHARHADDQHGEAFKSEQANHLKFILYIVGLIVAVFIVGSVGHAIAPALFTVTPRPAPLTLKQECEIGVFDMVRDRPKARFCIANRGVADLDALLLAEMNAYAHGYEHVSEYAKELYSYLPRSARGGRP